MSRFERSVIEAIPLGMKAANDYNANERADAQLKMQQAAEARNAAEYERKLGIENKVTALQEQLLNPNKGNYGLNGPSKFAAPEISSAMPIEDAAPIAAGLKVGGIGLTDGVNLGGVGVRASAPVNQGTGAQPSQQLGLAPSAKEQVLSNRQAPARGEEQRILAQIAMLKGDHEGYGRLRASADTMDYQDAFGGHLKSFLSASPEQQAAMSLDHVKHLNVNSKKVSLGQPGAKGFSNLHIVGDDGLVKETSLSLQDRAKLFAAAQMINTHPREAIAQMAEVNKELAATVAAENNLNIEVGKFNNDVAGKWHTAQHQDATLDAQIAHYKASEGLQRQRIEQGAKAQGDPKIIAQINDVAAQFENAKTPEERRVLEQKHNVLMSQLLVSMGKPRMLSYAPGGGENGKLTKIPEQDDGTYHMPDVGLVKPDGKGGYYKQDVGFAPKDFESTLRKSGLPDDFISSNVGQRSKYGDEVYFNDRAYPIANPQAMQQLKRDYEAYVVDTPNRARRESILDPRDAMAMDPELKRKTAAEAAVIRRRELGFSEPGFNLDSLGLTSWGGPHPANPPKKDPPPAKTTQQLGLSGLFNNRDPRYNTIGAVR